MVDAAGLDSAQTVVEIGPGLGIVTGQLVATGARVVAVEVDASLARALAENLGHPANLSVVHADALELDLAGYVEEPFSVVASLPYHVATPILFKLLFEAPAAARIVAMLQLEVAQRIAAARHPMTYLGIAMRLIAEPRLVRHVPPGAFHPVPKVRSAIVALDRRPHPLLNGKPPYTVAQFVRLGFTQPRQQLHNSLARGLGRPAGDVQLAIKAAGIDPKRRPGDLTVGEWLTLFDVVRGSTA
jgi:16S rRNA (adenine1518-N6/adenine1519-N6)-dimethyltransferase